jgi:hypothetical protein
MTLPGVTTEISERQPSPFAPPSTANWFVVGYADRGPVNVPVLITSLTQFVLVFGPRVAYSFLYDAVEAFFEEGGLNIYVVRLVGVDAVASTVHIFDQSGSSAPGDVALEITAKSPGNWGDKLNFEITAGGGNFTIIITHDDDGLLETSPALADRTEALAWAADSDYIELALGAHDEDPRAQGPTGLAGGDDDRGSVDADAIAAALALFTEDYGPGQVSMPGFTSSDANDAILAHCDTFKRIPHLDLVDTGDAATLIAACSALAAVDGHRFGAPFGPWAIVPGLTPGTTRTIPYSAIQAGMTAASEGTGNTVGDPVAAANGVSRWAVGLSQTFTDADRELLANAGYNVARVVEGEVRTYDYVTLANQLTDVDWVPLNGSRVLCAIAHEAKRIGEQHLMKKLDGKRHNISKFIGDVVGVGLKYWGNDDLFGETAEEAFTVTDTNTTETIAANKIRCLFAGKTTPFGRQVEIEITKEAS